MKWSRLLLGLAVLLLWAAPAYGVEELKMNCPVCDHVDVDGSGLEPNKTLVLSILDVRSGQKVIPDTKVTTNASGRFSREFEMNLAEHPSLLGNLYEQGGSSMVLAAHTRAQAPAHCAKAASLPYSGARSGIAAVAAGVLLAVGGALLLVTRRRDPADA
jgi:LPXTG-motif cell wall-anchored protein